MTMWTSQRIHRFYQPGLSPRFQKLCIFVQKRPPGHSNCSCSICPYTHSTTLQNRKSPIITEIDVSCAQFPANTYFIAWARWFKRFTTTYACPAVSSNFKGSKIQPTKHNFDQKNIRHWELVCDIHEAHEIPIFIGSLLKWISGKIHGWVKNLTQPSNHWLSQLT